MKNTLLFLITTVILSALFAQNPKVEWGPEYKAKRSEPVADVVGIDGENIYVWRTGMSMFNFDKEKLETYSYNNLKLANSEELQIPDYNGLKLNLMEMMMLHNKLILFSSRYDNDKKVSYVFAHNVDNNKVSPPSLISEISTKRDFFKSEIKDVHFSPDSSKLMVFHEPAAGKKDKMSFLIKVLDNKYNLLWENEVKLDYESELFRNYKMRLSNDGDVYLQGRVYEDKVKSKRKGKSNYSYKLLAFKNNGTEMEEYDISLGENFISSLTFKVNDQGNLVCAGYYSEEDANQMKGIFFMVINPDTKEVITKGTKDFDKQFLAQFMKEKKAAKGEELEEFVLDDIILRSDGGAVIVGEKYWSETVTRSYMSNGSWQTTTRTYYHYHDLIVSNINPDGSIAWNVQVPKYQVSIDDGGFYSSYVMAVRKDKIYLFYNDDKDNVGVLKGYKVDDTNFRDAVIMMTTIDGSGDVAKKMLLSGKDKTIFMPKLSKQVTDNQLVILAQKGKKYKLGKINL